MSEVVVLRTNGSLKLLADSSKTILELLNQSGTAIYAPCGGQGVCGKCKVRVSGDVSRPAPEEEQVLTAEELAGGVRLACKTYALGKAEIFLGDCYVNESKGRLTDDRRYKPNPMVTQKEVRLVEPAMALGESALDSIRKGLGKVEVGLPVLQDICRRIDYGRSGVFTLYGDEVLDLEYGRAAGTAYGVAVDVGTTTVACYLLDLAQGVQLAVASRQNPQFGIGADVISRINYTLEYESGLEELRQRIVAGVDGLIGEVTAKAAVDSRRIYQCVLVGNTTMAHIFWGLSCTSLARLPFNAVTSDLLVDRADSVGLTNMNANGKVVFLPGIAGFIGADTVGAMIAARLESARDCLLLIDLGTNGEIVLATPDGRRYACSTAAGPAFEGARITHGVQAFAGAIDTVRIGDDLQYTTIDGQAARGICGSGLIDLVSELVRTGLVAADGKIAAPETVGNEKLAGRIVRTGRHREIVVAREGETADGEAITLTQKDIRELQVAKAAIRAGINILLKQAGISSDKVDHILLAGAFGNFINKDSALRIGIIPDLEAAKIISLGNAAGEGAKMALADRDILYGIAGRLAAGTVNVDIASHPDFQEEFVQGMYLG